MKLSELSVSVKRNMSARSKTVEPVLCEKYMNRLLKEQPSAGSSRKNRERSSPSKINTQLIKKVSRQTNFISPSIIRQKNMIESDLEVKTKSSSKSRRYSSSGDDKQSWGSLLKGQKVRDSSQFSNFDPLRTLHFLAKELHYNLQHILPEESSIHQMVSDMQLALKRVPPEVASTIHLHQQLEILPPSRSRSFASVDYEKPEKLIQKRTETRSVQTENNNEDIERVQLKIAQSTIKLEQTCQQMEEMCANLKYEKEQLENRLQSEKDTAQYFKQRLELSEKEKDTMSIKTFKLEEENRTLQFEITDLNSKLETAVSKSSNNEYKNLVKDLKKAKSALEHDCALAKHQLEMCVMEKDKYIAILEVRDQQINEIRNEMAQLQDVVNEQLMELHANAFNEPFSPEDVCNFGFGDNKENNDENTLTTIATDDNFKGKLREINFDDVPSSSALQEVYDSRGG